MRANMSYLLSAALAYFMLPAPGLTYAAAYPVAYMTVCLGMLEVPGTRRMQHTDYSYGIYLFHWPVFLVLARERVHWPVVPLLALSLVSGIQAVRSGDLSRSIWLHVGFNALAAIGRTAEARELFETLLDSTIQMVRNIPALALIPLVILWFGAAAANVLPQVNAWVWVTLASATLLTVGARVSMVRLTVLPAVLRFPAASLNLPLVTVTLPGVMLFGVGVKVAV